MKRLIVALNILVISITFGQNIRISKDTLMYLQGNYPHPWEMFDLTDSMYVSNSDTKTLFVDSILTKKYFHYFLKVFNKEKIEKSDYIGRYSTIFPVEIPPKDSLKFVFCFIVPITKMSYSTEMWSDSLFIYNNSINKPIETIAVFNDIPLDIVDNQEFPTNYNLFQNYPNPFNPTTKIKYSIPNSEKVLLKVYDVLGREVETLLNEYENAGTYEIEFNGSNLTSGIYFYKITSGNYSETRKMILLR
ncbi:T9SS type A sorting domain-containing protein [Stygiobacter electus]|uniref:T9SS type A sorting domain-containing protein n=1 Tax=Stygiobacter electus TaxID=3032292 RepID=A0AAE3P033_9BACT|nr:T9SS type A sorting domain-containing protein [Stygiobacter electus]MDF1611795.1 T9SS type A sorting domain-containing protein [Stygiobacter electus]